MKTMMFPLLFIIGFSLAVISCKSKTGARYLDLNTGKEVVLVKDSSTGLWVDVDTRKPVRMYVDTRTNDTIYGSTGKVINGRITRSGDGVYVYADENDNDHNNHNHDNSDNHSNSDGYEKKTNDGLKVEVEKDGDIKIKDGDQKIKIDGETGEKKVKND